MSAQVQKETLYSYRTNVHTFSGKRSTFRERPRKSARKWLKVVCRQDSAFCGFLIVWPKQHSKDHFQMIKLFSRLMKKTTADDVRMTAWGICLFGKWKKYHWVWFGIHVQYVLESNLLICVFLTILCRDESCTVENERIRVHLFEKKLSKYFLRKDLWAA